MRFYISDFLFRNTLIRYVHSLIEHLKIKSNRLSNNVCIVVVMNRNICTSAISEIKVAIDRILNLFVPYLFYSKNKKHHNNFV